MSFWGEKSHLLCPVMQFQVHMLFIYSGRQLAFSVSSWPGASFQNKT
jgi:hypothetical protein